MDFSGRRTYLQSNILPAIDVYSIYIYIYIYLSLQKQCYLGIASFQVLYLQPVRSPQNPATEDLDFPNWQHPKYATAPAKR